MATASLRRVTPHINNASSALKIINVIHQAKSMISDFVLIYRQPQAKYKNLESDKMNRKMSQVLQRMKYQAVTEYKVLAHELGFNEIEPNEDLIFVKYRVVGSRVLPQVLIELDFNKLL